jgi:hypothetical protein
VELAGSSAGPQRPARGVAQHGHRHRREARDEDAGAECKRSSNLIAAIDEFLTAHNQDPKPFVWTASIDTILEKVGRCKAVIETVH